MPLAETSKNHACWTLEACIHCCVQVLSQAALIEFHKGTADRARSIFESILRNYPKRLDLWSVYLDQVRAPSPHASAEAQMILVFDRTWAFHAAQTLH